MGMGVWMLPKPAAEPQGVETANVPAEETRNVPAATGTSSGIRLGRMGMELSDAGQELQVTHPGRERMLLPLTQRHPPLRVWRCGGWHDTSDPPGATATAPKAAGTEAARRGRGGAAGEPFPRNCGVFAALPLCHGNACLARRSLAAQIVPKGHRRGAGGSAGAAGTAPDS